MSECVCFVSSYIPTNVKHAHNFAEVGALFATALIFVTDGKASEAAVEALARMLEDLCLFGTAATANPQRFGIELQNHRAPSLSGAVSHQMRWDRVFAGSLKPSHGG